MPTDPPMPALTLGAYAIAPPPETDGGRAERELYDALGDVPFDAYELPLVAEGLPGLELDWVRARVPEDRDLVVTAIPRTMVRLGRDASYGLASSDEDGRQAALADLAVVRDLALRLADASGRRRVLAIEVHSAPGPDGMNGRGGAPGSSEAFARSLVEIASWGLGARVVVEHCDRLVEGQVPEKGFFPVVDEIAAVRRADELGAMPLDDGSAALGLSLNWGRSALEDRSGQAPVEHARAAAEAGLLRGVILSGATPEATAWGAPWSDGHIPPRGEAPALAGSTASALDLDAARATFAAAGDGLDYVGAKVSVRPLDASVAERVALAEASLELVRRAFAG